MPTTVSDPENEVDPFADARVASDDDQPSAPHPATPKQGGGTLIPPWQDGPTRDLAADDEPNEDPREDADPPTAESAPNDPDAQGEEPEKAEAAQEHEEDTEDDEPEEPKGPRHRWNPRGAGTHTRPKYREPRHTPRQTPVEWWRHQPARNRWALYNGTALAAGWAIGLPQLVTAETAYLVATYHSWTDPHVYFWYLVGVGIWGIDYQSRTWLPPAALAARIPLVSLIIGVLLYGSTDLPA